MDTTNQTEKRLRILRLINQVTAKKQTNKPRCRSGQVTRQYSGPENMEGSKEGGVSEGPRESP